MHVHQPSHVPAVPHWDMYTSIAHKRYPLVKHWPRRSTCGTAGWIQARTLVILLLRPVHSLLLGFAMHRPHLIVSIVPMDGVMPIP